MLATKADAAKDSITVPMTLQEYCITGKTNSSSGSLAASASVDVDFYDDDDDDDYVDDDDDIENDDNSAQGGADCEGDSGHGDS